MKSEYTDAELWLGAALAAISGLTTPAIGGSDTSVMNVVDVASRIADQHVKTFRSRESEMAKTPAVIEGDTTDAGTETGGRKAKRAS